MTLQLAVVGQRDLHAARAGGVALAEPQREPVEDLQQHVVAPELLIGDAELALQSEKALLDPPDELVDLGLGVGGSGELERVLRAVAAAVDAREMLADEHAGVAVARRDLGDARLVELEVQVDVDGQEVLRPARVGVEARTGLPRRASRCRGARPP